MERMYKASYGDASGTSATGGTHQMPVPAVRFLQFVADAEQIGQDVSLEAVLGISAPESQPRPRRGLFRLRIQPGEAESIQWRLRKSRNGQGFHRLHRVSPTLCVVALCQLQIYPVCPCFPAHNQL